MMKMLSILLLCLIAETAFLNVAADCNSAPLGDSSIYPTQFTTSRSGQATYYGVYTNGGACTLDPTPYSGTNGEIATVAIADNIWEGSKACGMCLNMTASGSGSGSSPIIGNYLVYVNDECPSCSINGIDLGLSGDGVWDISWKAVPCPVGSTKIQFLFQGSNPYYVKLQVRNSRYPIYGVAFLQSGKYVSLVRTADNFFTAGSGITFPLTFPITVKVTSVDGDIVVDSIASLTNSVVIDGTTQFLDCSSSSTAGPTSKPTAGPTSGPVSYIYTDALESPFEDWSWATVNSANPTPVHSGARSYSFIPDSWQAAFFHCSQCINSTQATSVQFYIYPTTPNVKITFALVQGSNSVASTVKDLSTLSALAVNTWNKVTAPIPSGTYDGLWLQDATGGTQGIVYVDTMTLVK